MLNEFEEQVRDTDDGFVFKLMHIGDIETKPVSWLIKDFAETDTFIEFFGDPESYKTFIAIDWACCIASGKDYCGRKVKQGTVIFISGEGKNGLKRRFDAWAIRNQVDLKDIPLFVSLAPTGLCDAEQTKFVIDAVKKVAEQNGDPVLIVIDTLARNFGPGDENSTKDMSGFVNSCDLLRCQYYSSILLVHHSGHADKTRARGSMALKGAIDAEYRLDKDDFDIIRMVCKKMKDAPKPEPMAFKPAIVELGIYDEDGDPVTSVILNETTYEPPEQTGNKGSGKNQIKGLKILHNLFDEHRENLTKSGFDPETARVSVEDWKKACVKPGEEGMDRRAFPKIRDSLQSAGFVKIEKGFVEIV